MTDSTKSTLKELQEILLEACGPEEALTLFELTYSIYAKNMPEDMEAVENQYNELQELLNGKLRIPAILALFGTLAVLLRHYTQGYEVEDTKDSSTVN